MKMKKHLKRPPRFLGIIGMTVVLTAFVLAVINALLDNEIMFIKSVLQPFIFVGIACLLYHIGQHVHVLHENSITMLGMEMEEEDD